jgi:polyhydroxyalkanoate synthesis regulator phasin
MNSFLNKVTKKLLLGESLETGPAAYLQAVQDLINQVKPGSKKDSHRLNSVRESLSKLKSHFRKLEEKVIRLEEELKVLQENNRGE